MSPATNSLISTYLCLVEYLSQIIKQEIKKRGFIEAKPWQLISARIYTFSDSSEWEAVSKLLTGTVMWIIRKYMTV